MELKVYLHHCYRCNHEWPSKNPKPTYCPKCKSKLWHTPRTKHRRKAIPSEAVTVAGSTQINKPEVPEADIGFNPIVKIRKMLSDE